MSTKAKDILRGLLTRNPEKRLGANGADEIKRDPFFADVNWDILLAKKYQTPFKPNVVRNRKAFYWSIGKRTRHVKLWYWIYFRSTGGFFSRRFSDFGYDARAIWRIQLRWQRIGKCFFERDRQDAKDECSRVDLDQSTIKEMRFALI